MIEVRRFRVVPDEPLVGEIDSDARIAAVPDRLMTKGMYILRFASRLDPREVRTLWHRLRAPPRHGRYQPFLDYPFADALVFVDAVARREHPDVSPLEAMRRLGRETVRAFLDSSTGRVVGRLTRSAEESLLKLPEIWRITDPQNVARAEAAGPGAVRLDIEGFPAWLDCGVIGTLEQIVMNHRARPEIDVALLGPARATMIVHVLPPG